MQFSGKKEVSTTKAVTTDSGSTASTLPVAYVNVDSLLENYNYAKDLNEIILKNEQASCQHNWRFH